MKLELVGDLQPQRSGGVARIRGQFTYSTEGALIGPLVFLPDPVISAAAGAVNR